MEGTKYSKSGNTGMECQDWGLLYVLVILISGTHITGSQLLGSRILSIVRNRFFFVNVLGTGFHTYFSVTRFSCLL